MNYRETPLLLPTTMNVSGDPFQMATIPERSFENLWQALAAAVVSLDTNAFLLEVKDDFCVYGCEGKLHKIGYTNSAEEVRLVGQPVEVKEVTVYRPMQEQNPAAAAGTTRNSIPMFKNGTTFETPNARSPVMNVVEAPLPLPTLNFDKPANKKKGGQGNLNQNDESDALPLPRMW